MQCLEVSGAVRYIYIYIYIYIYVYRRLNIYFYFHNKCAAPSNIHSTFRGPCTVIYSYNKTNEMH
jgi:hypothetical protein